VERVHAVTVVAVGCVCSWVKGWFRSAKALHGLGKLELAVQAAQKAQQLEPNNRDVSHKSAHLEHVLSAASCIMHHAASACSNVMDVVKVSSGTQAIWAAVRGLGQHLCTKHTFASWPSGWDTPIPAAWQHCHNHSLDGAVHRFMH
jgi:hypothetical protein